MEKPQCKRCGIIPAKGGGCNNKYCTYSSQLFDVNKNITGSILEAIEDTQKIALEELKEKGLVMDYSVHRIGCYCCNINKTRYCN